MKFKTIKQCCTLKGDILSGLREKIPLLYCPFLKASRQSRYSPSGLSSAKQVQLYFPASFSFLQVQERSCPSSSLALQL